MLNRPYRLKKISSVQLKRRNPHLQCPHYGANDYTPLSKYLHVIQQTGL